ncbi:MAG: Ig domain-containing protein [Quinella sp. 2Q5]|nr:Ig domain-containing protein [Quinella sp. 2Q5]
MIRKFFAAIILTVLMAFAPTAQADDYFEIQGHVSGYGWQEPVDNGGVIGTIGESRALEAMVINFRGGIKYSAHVHNIGWQGWVYSGDVAGTVGQSLPMEAVRIQLVGRSENYYDVYYRAHVQNYGWLGWAKNGEPAGTQGANLRMEALQIQLVSKGEHFRRDNRPSFYRE